MYHHQHPHNECALGNGNFLASPKIERNQIRTHTHTKTEILKHSCFHWQCKQTMYCVVQALDNVALDTVCVREQIFLHNYLIIRYTELII